MRSKALLFISVVLLSACQKQESTIKTKNNLLATTTLSPSDTALLGKLSRYNDANFGTVSTFDACSGFFDCLGFSLGLAAADITGAAAGVESAGVLIGAAGIGTGGTGAAVVTVSAGVIGAAGGSYLAYKTMAPTKLDQDNPKNGDIDVNVPLTLDSAVLVAGTDHNSILHFQFFNNVPMTDYYSTKGFSSDEISFLESQPIVDMNNKIKAAATQYGQDRNIDNMLISLTNAGYLTNIELEVLSNFLHAYLQIEDISQLQPLIQYYVDTVNNATGVSDNEKFALTAAFLVASTSPYYFSTTL